MLQIKANGVEVSALICRVLWSKLLEHREHDLIFQRQLELAMLRKTFPDYDMVEVTTPDL